jgi:SAM-dependent methyltransferase
MINSDPRELEWQRRYEENDTPWDKGIAAPALDQYLDSHTIEGRILVPGCGRGHEVRALASRSNCSVVGLDLSATAIAEAAALAHRAKTGPVAVFVVGDFFELPPEWMGTFDWIVEHTCFCAIEPRQRPAYVRSCAEALRNGGRIFGIFYLNPDTESGPPFAIRREELLSLFEAGFSVLKEWVPNVSFPGRENRELVLIFQKR